jgi:hypothetical protein
LARRVFFSFHYERDIWRANVVRNAWVGRDREASGFFDGSLWEKTKTSGDAAIKHLIDHALQNTSVTVVLIGAQTAEREYVRYEIQRSIERGNGVLGVRIEKLENSQGRTDEPGRNPLPAGYTLYRWYADKGYLNFGAWVEAAARAAGR